MIFSGERSVKPFKFRSPREERIYRRLLLVGKGPAAFYRDACRLLSEDSFYESTTHLVAHLLREIESAMRDVLKTFEETERDHKKTNKNEDSHNKQIKAILKGLKIEESEAVAQAWLKLTDKTNDYKPHRLAHRDNLSAPRSIDENYSKFWDEIQLIFEVILDKFESTYIKIHQTLDVLLAKDIPHENDIETLKLHIPHNEVSLGYFFVALQSPLWIVPLRDAGLFNRPPPPLRDETTISFSPWPESQ